MLCQHSTAPSQLTIGSVTGSSSAQNFVGVFNGAITIGRQDESHRRCGPSIGLQHLNDPQENRHRVNSDCLNALFVTDPYTDRETLISLKGTRVNGTCLWITKHESFLSWLGGRTRLLWISGGPGKGKTMISIFLTEELEKLENEIMPYNLVFFFCSHGDEKRNTALGILRSLIYQILLKSPQLIKHTEAYFATPERIAQTLSLLDSLWILFTRLIDDPEFPPTRCVVDGLDECDKDTRRQLVVKLRKLLEAATDSNSPQAPLSTKLRLVVISRSVPDLRGCTEIKIDPDNNQRTTDDIGRFVSARVQELSKIEYMTAEVQSHVETTLRARAQGTFLWVGFAMHELLQQDTCSDILDMLNRIPAGLFAIYSRMLLQIPPKRRELSRNILDWVTMAMRPPKLLELAAAIDIKQTSSLIDKEHAIRDAVSACGPLLKFDREVVTLVHQSARDYLLRKTPDDDFALEAFRIRPSAAHQKIAQKCFECILFHNLYRAGHGGKRHDQFYTGLFLYSGFNVRQHVESIRPLNGRLDHVAKRMFSVQFDKKSQWWLWPRCAIIGLDWIDLPPLHMACHLGIVSWTSILLKGSFRQPRIKARLELQAGRSRQTPLQIAAQEGQGLVVENLIKLGANIGAVNKYGETVLDTAIYSGHSSVVAPLLRRGAKTGGMSMIYTYAASGIESTEMWEMLVKQKMNIHEISALGKTALHEAASCGTTGTARLLIEHGIDVNARKGNGETALHCATAEGHQALVELLLASGANFATKTYHGYTALDYARLFIRTAVIQVLEEYVKELRIAESSSKDSR